MDVQLFVDRAQVEAYGVDADAELRGGGFVLMALCQQF